MNLPRVGGLCRCGELGRFLCDEPAVTQRGDDSTVITCKAVLCEHCAYSPVPSKHLCPQHTPAHPQLEFVGA